MDQGPRVLVVDDEPNTTDPVATALRCGGFDVAVAGTGTDAIREAATFRPDLLVLDVMLPDRNGFELLSRLRADHVHLPVVFLTARDSTEDKVKGLTVGGDDYVTKPFSLEELIARVRAVLRRTRGETATGRLTFADLELDDDTHEVWRSRARIELTPTEYKLLRYLMHNARRVVSKAQILDHVWEYDFDGDANVVETYVSYLRKKLDPHGPPLIHTVRGVGYSLRLPPEA
jgi:two-component system OmpR family response regulator